MSNVQYTITTGDTFEGISRRCYGTERYAGLIQESNPGVLEPLIQGEVLFVPALQDTPRTITSSVPADNTSECAIIVNGSRFRFWSEMVLTRSIDAMDTLEFSAPFEGSDRSLRDTFRPFEYQQMQVAVGGEPLFTGTLVGVTPVVDDKSKTLSVSGYSTPGVLNDCTSPASSYPIEYNGQNLEAIANAVCAPFGVRVVFTGESGPNFTRAAAGPGETVIAFLTGLARQRGLVISSTPDGSLLFQVSKQEAPVAILTQGSSPLISVVPSFSPQQYYSHVTGLEPVLLGTQGSQYTVKNPHLAGTTRPLTFKAGDAQGGSIKTAVDAKLGRMYGNMAAYSVTVSTWRDPQGQLWEPNTTIQLLAPDAMVYNPYSFTVRSVAFSRDSNTESAKLDLVLPGAFNGQVPESMPWD